MGRWSAFIKKHRLWAEGLCLALAALLALAWAGYTLHQSSQNQSAYRIVHDEYTPGQVLYPTNPHVGLVQTLPKGAGEPLYGVRLMFATDGRVARGSFVAALKNSAGETVASSCNDMTMLLDGAFVDVIFDGGPAFLQQGESYQLHITFQPESEADLAGLVYGEGSAANPDLPLTDTISSVYGRRTAALQLIVNHTGSAYALKAFAPLAALLFLAVMGGWWLTRARRAKAPVCFAFFAAALGLCFALITPPLAAPDEYGHLAGAYSLANRLTGQPGVSEGPQGETLLAMRACDAAYMRQDSGPIGVLAYKTMTDEVFSLHNSPALTVQAPVSQPYSVQPLQYLPQALGILLARALGLGFHGMLLLGRLASLAAYVALAALAVRLAPVGQSVLFAVGLLPMALSLAGSLSADTMVNALALLFIALCLRGMFLPAVWGLPARLGLLALAALLAPMKAIYILLVGLCLPIQNQVLGGVRRARVYKALVWAAAAASWLWANGGTVGYMLRSVDVERIRLAALVLAPLALCAVLGWKRWGRTRAFRRALRVLPVLAAVLAVGVALWVAGNSGRTLTPEEYAASIQPNGESVYLYDPGYIITHLPQTAKLLLNTLGAQLPQYLQGLVGSLPGEPIVYGLQVSWVLTIGLLLVLAAACLRQVEEGPRLGRGQRWAMALVGLGVCGLTVLAALFWTPINMTVIFGIQGRYLLPVLPLGLLLLGENRLVCLRRDAAAGLRLCSGALAAAVALQSLVLFATAAYKP